MFKRKEAGFADTQNQGGVAFFFALEYYSLHIQMGAMEVALEFSIHVAP